MRLTEHIQRDAVQASFLMVPAHEVYRSRKIRKVAVEEPPKPIQNGEDWPTPKVKNHDCEEW